jgi:MOSC domain-containing protein YiiM
MFQGQLAAIFLGDCRGEDLHAVSAVEAVPGRGLAGDRYCAREGTFSAKDGPDREVTLIESEALAGLEREYGLALPAVKARRNLLTTGVPLNHLVGQDFQVGDVVLRGIRLCEPCNHLEKLTVPGVLKGLVHRGGLRAQIVRGGKLRVGDAVELATA